MSSLLTSGLGGPLLLTMGLGGSDAPPVLPPMEPNPAETAWTLGVGGAVVSPEVTVGFGVGLATVLLNAGVVVPYTSDAVLDAAVWAGGDGPILFPPTATWIDPTMGTLALAIGSGQTAGLEPGDYPLQVGVTDAGSRVLAYNGILKVTQSTGTVTARAPYCTMSDLEIYYDQIGILMNRANDSTGFLEVRTWVSDEIDRDLILRYDPRDGFIKIRSNVRNPFCGFDVPSPTTLYPSKQDITTYLAAGGLILEKKLREIAARRTIAIILGRQTTGDMTYRQEAMDHAAVADEMFRCYWAQIDKDDDGKADYLIARDVTILPAGTAA